MTPVERVTARVLPVDPGGEVLLLQAQDPARPGDLHWVSVGGALDPGETHVDAALRELREETGVVAAAEALTGPVHVGSHAFSWDGVAYLNCSTFFALPLPRDTAVSLDHLEPAEVGNVLGARWWTPEALAAEGNAASPDLPDIMIAAIAAVRGEAFA